MRHLKSGRKLGRNGAHRKAMMCNLAASLVAEERIQTTDARAKELRRVAEHLITLAKRADRAAKDNTLKDEQKKAAAVFYRRLAFKTLHNHQLVQKLFDVLTPRFATLPDGRVWAGGYTRIQKVGYRNGDNAPLSLIEFIGAEIKRPTPKAASETDNTAQA